MILEPSNETKVFLAERLSFGMSKSPHEEPLRTTVVLCAALLLVSAKIEHVCMCVCVCMRPQKGSAMSV